jgi:hypothetical protein
MGVVAAFYPRPHIQTTGTRRRPTIAKIAFGLFLITLAPCLYSTSASAQTATTYVSSSGNDQNPCTAVSPCRTLQEALAKTAPGGQVYALDSANYGYVNISASVSIISGRGTTGVLATSNITGVNINAANSDSITLRGLDIDGTGSGATGVQFTSGASLNIENSVISGFANGINFQPSGSSSLLVSRTVISNNAIGIDLHGGATTNSVLNNVKLVENGTAIATLGAGRTAAANVALQNSVIANNSTVGIAGGAFSAISVSRSSITNNAIGVQAQTASSRVNLSNSTIAGNGTAWQAFNGGNVTNGRGSTTMTATLIVRPATQGPYLLDNQGGYLLDDQGLKLLAK